MPATRQKIAATIAVLRLTTAGQPDSTFDGDGVRNTQLQAGSNGTAFSSMTT